MGETRDRHPLPMNDTLRHLILLAGPEGSTTADYDFDLAKRVLLGLDHFLEPDAQGITRSQFWLVHVGET